MKPSETLHIHKTAGFSVRIDFYPEQEELESSFSECCTSDEIREMYAAIGRGDTVWFFCVITVSAPVLGDLGTSVLGGCHYTSYEEFMKDRQVLRGLVADAVAETRELLKAHSDAYERLARVKRLEERYAMTDRPVRVTNDLYSVSITHHCESSIVVDICPSQDESYSMKYCTADLRSLKAWERNKNRA